RHRLTRRHRDAMEGLVVVAEIHRQRSKPGRPVGFDRRFASGHITWPIKEKLVFNTRSWTPGTDGAERGRAVLAPTSDEELEALRGHLKGAWVIATSGTYAPRFGSDRDQLRDRFGALCDEEGISGVIRPSGKNGLLRTSGNYRIEWDNLPTRVSILLLRDQFSLIYDYLKEGQEVELEFDIDQSFTEGPIPQYNVIAEIPGTDLADELMIFGGHLDSWDGAGGAQDNGTGTSTTLEAARLLMKAMTEHGVQPRRTIRFMLWGGEEQGLLGSRAYIAQHPEENERISAVIVHDGGTNACSGIRATPLMMPLFQEAFAPIIQYTADEEDDNLRFRLVSAERLPRGIGSDHDAYLSANVPGFFWEQRGTANYSYVHHTQHDWVPQVVQAYQRGTARVVASAAWRLANMNQTVPRDDMGQRQQRGQRDRNAKRVGVFLGEGMEITDLVGDGLAKKAGMAKGDVIVSVDGKEVANQRKLATTLRELKKDSAKIVWKRGDKLMAATFDWKAKTAVSTEP
ncbi:MAG: M20/M25/M40 family metallo-hydrolase, partial [Planctomycetota bacterium]|nr:M20/M25/M40 family metallo-hydrolase [Planctomycetota bacterium]